MHLARVVVENYRGFTRLELDLEKTTVLIGENNTGKTSMLDAVRTCLSRTFARRGNPFEDHDYHLPSDKARPGDAGSLTITVDFAEAKPSEWPPEILQTLPDAAVLYTGDLYHITLRVTSQFDKTLGDFLTDWDFLDAAGKPMPKAKRTQNLIALQQLSPVYYLSALRDAARDFGTRAAFWAPFLRNPAISPQLQTQLEKEMASLNGKIIKAEPRLTKVKDHLAKAQKVVTLGGKDVVDIEAIPSKVWEMLSRAQVNVAGVTGASLPLARHGAGTQSLASIFLFEAFLESGITKPDPFSEAILAIEEPEAHLHPSAVRALWGTLDAVKGQKLIASHSGDLLSEVPLDAIRRFRRAGNTVEVRQLGPKTLSDNEARKIQFHVRRTRGELLFARCWLLYEGETEYWILAESARAMGHNLEQVGVRLVEYADVGVASLVKLANDLGIEWHCLCDGDASGQGNRKSLAKLLNGRAEAKHVTVLSEDNMELCLCNAGYGNIYETNIDSNKKGQATSKKGDPNYWKEVLGAQPRGYKPKCAVTVAQEIETKGKAAVPKQLSDCIDSAITLTK